MSHDITITNYLTKHGNATAQEITDDTEVPRASVYYTLKRIGAMSMYRDGRKVWALPTDSREERALEKLKSGLQLITEAQRELEEIYGLTLAEETVPVFDPPKKKNRNPFATEL